MTLPDIFNNWGVRMHYSSMVQFRECICLKKTEWTMTEILELPAILPTPTNHQQTD